MVIRQLRRGGFALPLVTGRSNAMVGGRPFNFLFSIDNFLPVAELLIWPATEPLDCAQDERIGENPKHEIRDTKIEDRRLRTEKIRQVSS